MVTNCFIISFSNSSLSSVLPRFGDIGCYVDEVDKNAFIFGDKEKLTLVSGDQAFTQAMVGRARTR